MSTDEQQRHLQWTSIQGHILTGGNMAEQYYIPERGYRYETDELPHFHLLNGTIDETFQKWKSSEQQEKHGKHVDDDNDNKSSATVPVPVPPIPVLPSKVITGAWKRTLFVGGWNRTTNHDEMVYNIQTNNLFIDLRIPTTRRHCLPPCPLSSSTPPKEDEDDDDDIFSYDAVYSYLNQLSCDELRFYARQHVFAGYSRIEERRRQEQQRSDGQEEEQQKQQQPPCDDTNPSLYCTRHHCIDWNFIGTPRSRPNKWWIVTPNDINNEKEREVRQEQSRSNVEGIINVWKEYSYAKDYNGQYYYMEQWERLSNNDDGSSSSSRLSVQPSSSSKTETKAAKVPRLAIKKRRRSRPTKADTGTGTGSSSSSSDNCNSNSNKMSLLPSDSILVVVGNHFNYIQCHEYYSPIRTTTTTITNDSSSDGDGADVGKYDHCTSLVQLVDHATSLSSTSSSTSSSSDDDNDIHIQLAKEYLCRIQAGHGTIAPKTMDDTTATTTTSSSSSSPLPWTFDCAIPPQWEGKSLFYGNGTGGNDNDDNVTSTHLPRVILMNEQQNDENDDNNDVDVVDSADIDTVVAIQWKTELWDIYDSNFESIEELQNFLPSC